MSANNIKDFENRLWEAADHLRANSALRLNEFAEPVLGLIFLKFAGVKHSKTEKEIAEERKSKTKNHGGASIARERPVSSTDYHARGTLFVPEKARFSYLIELPEGSDMGKAVNDAMKEIEAENKELAGILPKSFQNLDSRSIITLLKNFNQIPDDIEGDAFGRIYEYFLGKFAIADGSGGGEFFTPTSIVKLIVEILEPFKGYIYDPACGSGGMFVQSVEFIKRHFENGKKLKAAREVSIYGQEKTDQTVRIAKMNLAIHGLSGDIRQGNTFYEDLHRSIGKFDYTMANPPFNVSGVDMERIKDDPRFSYGIPKSDNANYLWIQIFLNALNKRGRAGFVMHNSAADAELEIRKGIIEDNVVDVVITTSANLFYNVSLPCSLWFFDKNRNRQNCKKILFIDASSLYSVIDTAHREITDSQIRELSDMVQSFRKNPSKFKNISGICAAVSLDQVKENKYSLNPKVYIEYKGNHSKEIQGSSNLQVEDLLSEIESRKKELTKLLGNSIILDRGFLYSYARILFQKLKHEIEKGNQKEIPIRDYVEYYIGGTWGEESEDSTSKNKVKVYRGTDLDPSVLGILDKVPTRFIKDSQLESRELLSGDVIIEVSGGGKEVSTGRTMLVTPELLNRFEVKSVCASFCKLIRFKPSISPSYAFLFFRDLHKNGLMAKYEVQSTGIKNFKFENFLDKQTIPFGSTDIQKTFETRVSKIFGLIHLLGALDEKLSRLTLQEADEHEHLFSKIS